jgi:hypothetical protein
VIPLLTELKNVFLAPVATEISPLTGLRFANCLWSRVPSQPVRGNIFVAPASPKKVSSPVRGGISLSSSQVKDVTLVVINLELGQEFEVSLAKCAPRMLIQGNLFQRSGLATDSAQIDPATIQN